MVFIKPEELEVRVKENKYVVVAVSAQWCGPCQMMTSTVWEPINAEKTDITIFKIDADENGEWAKEQGVAGLPTMFVYKDGVKIKEFSGFVPREVFEKNVRG